MTTLSSLLGASGAPYASGRFYPLTILNNFVANNGDANRDYILPFTPRADVTIDAVGWVRRSTAAANIYVGIYDATGSLLTDCAVDSETSTGLHEVSTTAVTLSGSTPYYALLNQSVSAIANIDAISTTGAAYPLQLTGYAEGFAKLGGTYPSSPINFGSGVHYKARTAAAPLSSLTMTGWTFDGNLLPHIGFTVQ